MQANEIRNSKTVKLGVSAVFLALALVLPLFIAANIPEIGRVLLPMHIPVLLCGMICGAPYGLIVGVMAPILRSMLFGMPPMLPNAVIMSFELGAYGLVSGLAYQYLRGSYRGALYSLLIAMFLGRIIWGIVAFIVYKAMGIPFTFHIYMTQAFLGAIPGIILQIVLIPILVYKFPLEKMRLS